MRRFSVLITTLLLFARGPSENDEFKKAQSKNTIPAYQDFLKNWPQGVHRTEANDTLDTLLYEQAKSRDTIQSFKQFLEARGSDTRHLKEAKARLDFLQSMNSIENMLNGEDLGGKLDAMGELQRLPLGKELLRFVPALIALLDNHRVVRFYDNVATAGGFAFSADGIRPATMRIDEVATFAQEALEHITGQKLGKNSKSWRQWWESNSSTR